jgi:hypothetical protein
MENFVPTNNTYAFFMCMYVNTTSPSANPTIRFQAWGRPEINRTGIDNNTVGIQSNFSSGIQVVAMTDVWVIPPHGNLTRYRQAADINRQMIINVSLGSSLAYSIRTDNTSQPATKYLSSGRTSAKIDWPARLPVEISMFNPDGVNPVVVSITITALKPSNTGTKLAIGLGISLGFLALISLGVGITMLYRWRRQKRLVEMGNSSGTEDMVGGFNSYKKANSLGTDPKILLADNLVTSESGPHGGNIGLLISVDDPPSQPFMPTEFMEPQNMVVSINPDMKVAESHQPPLQPQQANIYFNSEPLLNKQQPRAPRLDGSQG